MLHSTNTTWAPTFGKILGDLVSLLHLDEEEVGGADADSLTRSDESARKYYKGNAIPWKENLVLNAFAAAMLHSRAAEPLNAWAETITRLAPAYGVPIPTQRDAVNAVMENLRALYETYPCELALLVTAGGENHLTRYALLRMIVPDLAVRVGAMAGMGWLPQPDTWTLDWAKKDGLSPLARELAKLNIGIEDLVEGLSKEKACDSLSRTAIHDRQTRKPCDYRVLALIAGELAKHAKAAPATTERRLRFEYMLWVMGGMLAEAFGWDAVTDLAFVLREIAQVMANTSSPFNPQWSSDASRRWSICMTVLEGTTWQPTRDAFRKMASDIPAWRDDYLAIADGRTVDRLGAWQKWFASLPQSVDGNVAAAVEDVVRWMNLLSAPESMDQQPVSATEPPGLRCLVRASAHEAKSEFAAAAGSYEEAIRSDPDNPGLWTQMALNLSAAGQQDKALGAMERARQLAPESGSIQCEHAGMLIDAGHPREALAVLGCVRDEVLRDSYRFHFQRGRALYQLGQYKDALTDFMRTIERRSSLGEAAAYAAVCAGHFPDTKKTKSLAAQARNLGAAGRIEALQRAERHR